CQLLQSVMPTSKWSIQKSVSLGILKIDGSATGWN
ncbi:hypothetical protein A2U01_0066829, partial [Trifolium medium]|nr:hypothetical protein [Trifolium medium]